MSAALDLQNAVLAVLQRTTDGFVILAKTEKELLSDLASSDLLMKGLGVFVLDPLEATALQGVSFVFIDNYEVRVRIMELPNFNSGPATKEVKAQVMHGLHWQPSKAIDAEVARRLALVGNTASVGDILAELQTAPAFTPFFALGAMLSHPISLARRPVDAVDGKIEVPGFEQNGELIRVTDVVFTAVAQVP